MPSQFPIQQHRYLRNQQIYYRIKIAKTTDARVCASIYIKLYYETVKFVLLPEKKKLHLVCQNYLGVEDYLKRDQLFMRFLPTHS